MMHMMLSQEELLHLALQVKNVQPYNGRIYFEWARSLMQSNLMQAISYLNMSIIHYNNAITEKRAFGLTEDSRILADSIAGKNKALFYQDCMPVLAFTFDPDSITPHAEPTTLEQATLFFDNNGVPPKNLEAADTLIFGQCALKIATYYAHRERNGEKANYYLNIQARYLLSSMTTHVIIAEHWAQRAFALHLQKKYDDSSECITNCLKQPTETPWWQAFAYCVQTLNHLAVKDFTSALQSAQRALDLYQSNGWTHTVQYARFINRVGNIYFEMALAHDAEPIYSSQLEIIRAHYAKTVELFNTALKYVLTSLDTWRKLAGPDFKQNVFALRTVLNIIQFFNQQDYIKLIPWTSAKQYLKMADKMISRIGLKNCVQESVKLEQELRATAEAQIKQLSAKEIEMLTKIYTPQPKPKPNVSLFTKEVVEKCGLKLSR